MYTLTIMCYLNGNEIIEEFTEEQWIEAFKKAKAMSKFAETIGWTRHNAFPSDIAHMDYFSSGWNEGHIVLERK